MSNEAETAESSEDIQETFEVEKILDKKIDEHGKVHYFIKWKGYTLEESNWEPVENLSCNKLIKEFEKERKAQEAKEAKQAKEPKTPKEPKEAKQAKVAKEPKTPKEPKEAKQAKVAKESKSPKKPNEPKEAKELKEPKESKEPKEPKELKGSKVPKVPKGPKDPKEEKIENKKNSTSIQKTPKKPSNKSPARRKLEQENTPQTVEYPEVDLPPEDNVKVFHTYPDPQRFAAKNYEIHLKEKELKSIGSAYNFLGERVYLCTFTNRDMEIIPWKVIRKRYPTITEEYYNKRVAAANN
ncbi:unnamed protein product [Caenorhabditis brenneri]